MKIKKNLLLVSVLILSALFISACTDDEAPEENNDEVSRVRVINEDGSETANDAAPNNAGEDSKPEVKVEDESDSETDVEADEDDKPVVKVESVISSEGLQQIAGANASDGVSINSYSYGFNGGVFEFAFKAGGGSDPTIPEVSAGFDQNGDLVVSFPSLNADYLKDSLEGELDLGEDMPEVVIEDYLDGSRYIFKFGEKKTFKLTGDSEEKEILLEITL